MTKPIFPVAITGKIHVSEGLPNDGRPVQIVDTETFSRQVATHRKIARFELTEAVHLSDDQKLNQKISDPQYFSDYDQYIPFDQVNLDQFVIRNMGECGYALFANCDFKAEKPLFIYAGHYVQTSQSRLTGPQDRTTYVSAFPDLSSQVDAEMKGGIAGFAQHLPTQTPTNAAYLAEQKIASANLKPILACYRGFHYTLFVATRDIKKDELLGWDYGLGYWREPERAAHLRYLTSEGKMFSLNDSVKFSLQLEAFEKKDAKNVKPGINLEPIHKTLMTYRESVLVRNLREAIHATQTTFIFSYLCFLPKAVLFNDLTDNELESLYRQLDRIKEIAEMSDIDLLDKFRQQCSLIFSQSIPDIRENRVKKNLSLYHVNEAFHERFPACPRKNEIIISRDAFALRLYTKGIEVYQSGDYQKAISLWKLSKKAYKENGDEKALIKSYWNIGNAHLKLNNNEKAVKRLKKGKTVSIAFFNQHPAAKDVKKPEEFETRLAGIQ